VIRDIDSSAGHTISQKHNVVYEYLRQSADIQSPPELIQKFQNLLQSGRNENTEVSQAFEKIIFADPEQFNPFLSKCFYLILASWLEEAQSAAYISQLLNILNLVGAGRSYDRRRKQLVQRVQVYQRSQSYQQLELLLGIIQPLGVAADDLSNSLSTNPSLGSTNISKTPKIASYLIRYPYLYRNLLPKELEIPRLDEQIAALQNHRQQDFEIRLSKHIIYRFRLKQVAKMKLMTKGGGKIITKADNPSLLSEKAFRVALEQYVGKLNGGSTLLERSQLFVAKNKHHKYGSFKQNLYLFLIEGIKPRSNIYQFASRLEEKLIDIFPQASEKPLNSTQTLQTCRQLFSFLIVDPAASKDPERFAELVANLGTAQVMKILIKITLICPESKADLVRKIGSIASYYRQHTVQEHPWLLKTLEHLLIAFSIYFGSVDVSIAKSAASKF